MLTAMPLSIVLALATTVAALARPQSASSNSTPTAVLDSGVVVGTTSTVTVPTTASAAATQYLGIPFASSPPKRFAPPEPPGKWSKPLIAQKRTAACLQQFSAAVDHDHRLEDIYNDPGSPPPAESEDCLYLNVFVPPGTKPGDKKAVLFWIFGGNLAFGTGMLHLYDGSSFAYNQDVIVVTPNYRTNIFGFPGSPQIDIDKQNLGFLDQRLALQWVQKNIGAFGGDAQRVTVFGQSAGGFSVRSLLGLPPEPLPFHSVIMESEAAFNSQLGFPTGNSSASSPWIQTVASVGCGGAQDQLECMRSKPAQQLKDYITSNSVSFFPTEDGKTYVPDLRPLLASGSAAKVPFMIGTNHDEGQFVSYCSGLAGNAANASAALSKIFPNNPAAVKTLAALANAQPLSDVVTKAVTDAVFICPSSQLASYAQQHGYQVYRYLFNGDFPNQRIFPGAAVYHAVEIPEVFGTYFLSDDYGKATTAQIDLSKAMQKAWADFAKNPGQGPGQGWPELGASGRMWNWGADGSGGGKEISAASVQPADCALFQVVPGQTPI